MGQHKDKAVKQEEEVADFLVKMAGGSMLFTLREEGHRLPSGAKAALNTFAELPFEEREAAFLAAFKLHQFSNQSTIFQAALDSKIWREVNLFQTIVAEADAREVANNTAKRGAQGTTTARRIKRQKM